MPCKHLAATFYLLAEAFDDDPFLILRWRGRDRETLLGRLRELRADSTSDGMPTEPDRPSGAVAGTALALTGLTYPGGAGDRPDRFGTLSAPLPGRPANMNVEPDLLLRQLPVPGATLGGQTLVDRLRRRTSGSGRSSRAGSDGIVMNQQANIDVLLETLGGVSNGFSQPILTENWLREL